MAHFSRLSWFAVVAAMSALPAVTVAQAQAEQKPVVSNSRGFKIPFRVPDGERAALKEIRLFVKTPTTEWKQDGSVGPEEMFFRCQVEEDGEYWYTVVTIDKQGKQVPSDVGKASVLLRVLVNTNQANPEKRDSDVTVTSPKAKEPSKQEIDCLIETAFGKNSPGSRRPIRLWLSDLGAVLVAEKATVAPGGRSVRFTSAGIHFDPRGVFSEATATAGRTFRGNEIVLEFAEPVSQLSELSARSLDLVRVHAKNQVTELTFATIMAKQVTPIDPIAPPGFPIGQAVTRVPEKGSSVATTRSMEVRFKFKIDPKTKLAGLLPTPMKATASPPHWSNEDLTKVPELAFGTPLSRTLPRSKAVEATAFGMAKINHLNLKKADGFMLAMLGQRDDLRGLPFLMGDACRTHEEQAKVFAMLADDVRRTLTLTQAKEEPIEEASFAFWKEIAELNLVVQEEAEKGPKGKTKRANRDHLQRTLVAVLMQILMPESETFRVGLPKNLATIPHIDATKALAKLAIFSPEESVRSAAIEGLKLRREKDYTDILMQGFTYPLPAVSKRAAEAIIKLERKDLLPNLIAVLETPDPRLPVKSKEGTVVRELVKINHHKNCLLCHAPGNTDNTPDSALKVAVPLPGEPLPKPSDGGGYRGTPSPTPDILVRIDMTYLRQDFSLMMPLSDAHPWPEMQRFDFLVRTRTLTAAEAQAYEPCCEEEEPGRLSPYHRSALFALRELTGRDTEPSAAAWRKLLKLPKGAS